MKRLITICSVIVLLSIGHARADWTTIIYPGFGNIVPSGISGNNIVGNYNDASGGHGVFYNGTTWTTINYPGATGTFINGIDGNNIVGTYGDANGGHGFLYNGTTWTTIDYPGAFDTQIYGISGNNIVGFSSTNNGYFGFIYTIPESAQPLGCSEQIPGDLNGDCKVDIEDFAIMASHWLQEGYVRIANFALGTNPNWTTQGQWQFGPPMGMGGLLHGYPDPIAAYTGQNVYGVNLNGDYTVAVGGPYSLTAGPFDCSSYTTVELSFARWLNIDTADYVQCKVEASNDGSTWQTVWSNPTTEPITDNQWLVVRYDISQIAAGYSQVYIRWSYQILNDRAYPYSGWNIDDVELRGLPN